MFDPQLQARFAKSCTDAALGYANATTAAYSDLFTRGCNFWLDIMQSSVAGAGSERPAATASPSPAASTNRMKGFAQPCAFTAPAFSFSDMTTSANPLAAWNAWLTNAWTANPWTANTAAANPWTAWASVLPNPWAAFGKPSSQMMTPFTAWMDMLQGRGSAHAWPMALAMMSAGVPSGVAWPTAEANMAALDAADVAKKSVNQALSTFRSGGGHASTPVWTADAVSAGAAPVILILAAVPVSMGLMSAWLPFWQAALPA